MGQEQSVPAPRRIPHKLSKPRTNSTANLLSRSNLFLRGKDGGLQDVPGQANRYSVAFADPDIRMDSVGNSLNTDHKRRSIFRSLSTPNKETLVARYDEEHAPEEDIETWVEKPRHNSMAVEPTYTSQQSSRPPNFSRMSLQQVPTFQSHQRLSLVAEVRTPEPEPSNFISTYAELRSPTMTSNVSMELPRTTSETELYTPMRRRSFLQHGVATRPDLTDARQLLPSQMNAPQVVSDYSNDSKPPLAYLASLKQQDMPRVETPDEVGYRHTGAFKLGTLRITNGTASPAPSIERAMTMSAGEDYISAGNSRRALQGHLRGESSRSNTFSISGERVKSPWAVRDDSPLRRTEIYSDLPPRIDDKFLELDISLDDFDFDSTFNPLATPDESQNLADEYIQDIVMSPYSFVPSRTPSPQLEPTSKHTAIEDELFDAEPLTPSLSHTPSNTDSGYSGPSRKSSEPRQKQLAKADSGYSSNFSVRSFRTESPAPPVPAKDFAPTPPSDVVSRVPSSVYSVADQSIRPLRPKPAPATSSRYVPQATLRDNEYHAIMKSISLVTPKAIVVTQTKTTNHITQPTSALSEACSAPNPKQKRIRSGSDPKANTHGSKPVSRKKEKQRPFSVQPERGLPLFTIQAQGLGEVINAPPIPQEATRNLNNRVDSFPMGAFANTFRGLGRSTSKETLGTILSVGSGYTEVPRGQELTITRLQEDLPPPPVLANSNSYHPPKTPPRKLQKRSSLTHDMVAYQDLDFGLVNSVTLDDSRKTTDGKVQMSTRSQSLTSDAESSIEGLSFVRSRTASAQSLTNPVAEPQRLSARSSYDSISSQTIWMSSKQSFENTSAPLSAPLQKESRYLEVEDPAERRLSWGNRDKRQPPVSMQTQRKVTPVSNSYKLFPTPPQRRQEPAPVVSLSKEASQPKQTPQPALKQSGRPPLPRSHKSLPPIPTPVQDVSPLHSPAPMHKDSPRPMNTSNQIANDPWTEQLSYWSNRRSEANDNREDQQRPSLSNPGRQSAVQVGKTEQKRPEFPNRNSSSTTQSRTTGRRPPSVHQNGNLRIQKSMEAVRARQFMEQKIHMQSTPNLRHSDTSQDIHHGHRGSIEDLRRSEERRLIREEFARQMRERDRAGEMLAGWEAKFDGSTPQEYHHTYGLPLPTSPYSPHHNEHGVHQVEEEYFPASNAGEGDFHHYSNFHRERNSTGDMLVLDRFSGGLAYGYESGLGVGGSAGTRGKGALGGGGRKSVDVSQNFGLDFSDVPVFLHNVPGEGIREVNYKR